MISSKPIYHIIDTIFLKTGCAFSLDYFRTGFFKERPEVSHYARNSVFILDFTDKDPFTSRDFTVSVIIYIELELPASISAVGFFLHNFSKNAYLRETQVKALGRITSSVCFNKNKNENQIKKSVFISTLPFSAFHGCVHYRQ
jgi:hypothetical protein